MNAKQAEELDFYYKAGSIHVRWPEIPVPVTYSAEATYAAESSGNFGERIITRLSAVTYTPDVADSGIIIRFSARCNLGVVPDSVRLEQELG